MKMGWGPKPQLQWTGCFLSALQGSTGRGPYLGVPPFRLHPRLYSCGRFAAVVIRDFAGRNGKALIPPQGEKASAGTSGGGAGTTSKGVSA